MSHFAAAHGSSGWDGSFRHPWDLQTALSGGKGRVLPGDTIWLKGGTYRGPFRSRLVGSSLAPIVVRQYPGERAIIDGAGSHYDTFVAAGAHTVFWGFELTNTDPRGSSSPSATERADMVANYASHTKFINLILHDGGVGFYASSDAGDVEISGCVIYNIGYQGPDRGHGHAVYAKSDFGPLLVRDNVMFNQYGFGVHAYTNRATGQLHNIHIDGNVIFDSGVLSTNSHSANILAGGGQVPADDLSVRDNMTYFVTSYGATNIQVGPTSALQNGSVAVSNNYAVGGTPVLYLGYWREASVTGDTLVGTSDIVTLADPDAAGGLGASGASGGSGATGEQWSQNVYYRDPGAAAWAYRGTRYPFHKWRAASGRGASDRVADVAPRTAHIAVLPNRYESGRATIVVYNWSRAASVTVDVLGVLAQGDRYEVRNVQDLFGEPVVSGRYSGEPISVPMAGVRPPPPFGMPTSRAPMTGPDFDVFLLTRVAP